MSLALIVSEDNIYKRYFTEIQNQNYVDIFLNWNPMSDLGNAGPVKSIESSGGGEEDKRWQIYFEENIAQMNIEMSFLGKTLSGFSRRFSFLLVLPVGPLLAQILGEVADPVADLPRVLAFIHVEHHKALKKWCESESQLWFWVLLIWLWKVRILVTGYHDDEDYPDNHHKGCPLLPSGSPFEGPGPHGDLFQFLGPHFCSNVPIFSI